MVEWIHKKAEEEAMKCHYCGNETDRRDFCLHCGTRWQEEPAAAVMPVAEELPEISDRELEAEFPTDFHLDLKPEAPALLLPDKRSLWKMVLFGILTLGIYPAVIWSRMVTELNIAASCHDGKRTMPYFAMLLLEPVTLGIFPLVWMHRFAGRIGSELSRRGIGYRFGARDFWLWGVLSTLILVGPFVFTCRLCRAMNLLNGDFNLRG